MIYLRQYDRRARLEIYSGLASKETGSVCLVSVQMRPFVESAGVWMWYGSVRGNGAGYDIALNASLSIQGEITALAHECAHILRRDIDSRTWSQSEIAQWQREQANRSQAQVQALAQVEKSADEIADEILTRWQNAGVIW